MFKLGDVLTKENYTEAANWLNVHYELGLMIGEVDGQDVIVEIPGPTEEEVRLIRNMYLEDTDIIVSVPDYPITEEEKELYLEYRQYLRDLPETEGFPDVKVQTFTEWNNQRKENVDD